MIGQIVNLAIDCIRSYVVPEASAPLVDDFRRRCHELIEHDIERLRHDNPPPGIAAPPPRGWADAWDHARRNFLPPRTVAEAERLVDEIHNIPMTATEVRRRRAEHIREVQREADVRYRNIAEHYQATVDLMTLGQSQLRIEPGQVQRVPPADWQNLFDVVDRVDGPAQPELGEDRAEPEPPTPLVEEKAKDILWSYLNELQRKDLFCANFFIVNGSVTGLIYRIVPGMQGNIYREDGARYCVTNPSLPSWDLLLAQKLMLEDDEGKFLTLARRLDLGEVADEPDLQTVQAMRETLLAGTVNAPVVGEEGVTFVGGEISPDLRPRGRSIVQIMRDSIRLNR